jgi:beta-phosphoglucomutase-like phosphatase (HAD superfamily)
VRERAAVFLDLDGVLVDNGPALRAAYGRAVGEVLRPILGGTHEAWAGALKAFLAAAPQPPVGLTPSETYRWEDVAGVTGPCGILGLTPPPEEECARLGRAIDRLVRLEYASFLPGAADAVRLLSAGRSVHMASGNAEWAVAGMLTRLGVRERVGVPCGADLVGVLKTSEASTRGCSRSAALRRARRSSWTTGRRS